MRDVGRMEMECRHFNISVHTLCSHPRNYTMCFSALPGENAKLRIGQCAWAGIYWKCGKEKSTKDMHYRVENGGENTWFLAGVPHFLSGR